MPDGVGPARGQGFGRDALRLDAAAEVARIGAGLRDGLATMRKRGVVVGLSGGIDSSVTAALSVAALGPDRVFGILMPEHDSDPESETLGRMLAERLGIECVREDIAPALQALGCYARRDEAIRAIVPDFGPGWGCKVVLDQAMRAQGYNISVLVVQAPDGTQQRHRLPAAAYLAVIAAANMKQRTRKLIEYTHADRLNYAVAGTPNRLEYDQGFFVKGGDGAADIKPIAHLFKTQVYQLADHLKLPEAIRRRPPTTDTWSLPQSQDEYYFSVDHATLDLCMAALDGGVDPQATARATGLTEAQVGIAWRDIAAKRRAAAYLHAGPLLIGPP
ncbi:NAD(+) synthase [Falsiroseomonas sp. HW251]|uniref:NAD(+) synthase n=1 Tax=Falsiroseomonas sp. HW251 TaxID=3390998 RepID=UPI003D31EED5